MIHKRFQHDTNAGGTEVQFNLEYDGHEVKVTTIQLHSNYDGGLPHSAHLEYDHNHNEFKLCTYYHKDVKGEVTLVKEWLVSPLAKEITKMIIDIKEQETPNFGKQ